MQFKKDADVRISDGSKIGTVDRVVVDPGSREITHLVVKKGLLFTKDKVMPVGEIASATEEEVLLKAGAEDPDKLPDFEESYYIQMNDPRIRDELNMENVSPVAWYHGYPGGIWWAGLGAYPGYARSPYVHASQRNVPPDTVPLEEGAMVMDQGGEDLGKVESIYVDPDGKFATHILVESGMLSKSRKVVPTKWIRSVAEDSIRLTVDKDFFESLPEYTEGH